MKQGDNRSLIDQPCLLCGATAWRNNGLCLDCLGELPMLGPHCALCAEPLAAGQTHLPCARCQQQTPPVSGTRVAFSYDWPLDELIQRFKFGRDLAAGRSLAQALALELQADPPAPPVDALVPMPLHWRRRWQRGFNQSAELALALGTALELPVRHGWARRLRATATQSQLTAAARRRNLAGAFSCPPLGGRPSVAIVDDVTTTGTTAFELARALLRAGAGNVQLWAIAKAGRQSRLR